MTEAVTLHNVERAINWFEIAGRDEGVLFHVIAGLNVLRDRAARDTGATEAAPTLSARLEQALLALAPVLCAETDELIPAEEVYAGLGCVAALVTQPDDCCRLDH